LGTNPALAERRIAIPEQVILRCVGTESTVKLGLKPNPEVLHYYREIVVIAP